MIRHDGGNASTVYPNRGVLPQPDHCHLWTLHERQNHSRKPHPGVAQAAYRLRNHCVSNWGYISDSPQTAVLNSVRFPGGNTKDFLKQIVGDRARDSTSDPLLLIFDECIGDLKPHYRSEEFRALFYQARHLGITTVLCCQDDIDLDRNLSNYAGHSIYLTEYTALAGLDRSGVPKSTRERVREVAPPLFAKPGYPRLVWTDAEKFSQFTLGQ